MNLTLWVSTVTTEPHCWNDFLYHTICFYCNSDVLRLKGQIVKLENFFKSPNTLLNVQNQKH